MLHDRCPQACTLCGCPAPAHRFEATVKVYSAEEGPTNPRPRAAASKQTVRGVGSGGAAAPQRVPSPQVRGPFPGLPRGPEAPEAALLPVRRAPGGLLRA